MNRPDYDLAAAVGEGAATQVLADRLAVSMHRRRTSDTIHEFGLITETERLGDVQPDLARNIGEREEISQPLPGLQSDRHRQSTDIPVGVSADEGHLVVGQGVVGLQLLVGELGSKAWVRRPFDGGHGSRSRSVRKRGCLGGQKVLDLP